MVVPRKLNRSEDSGGDDVDSDFSIDENDEAISDNEDDKPKRIKRLVTKAYRVKVWKMITIQN